MICFYLCFSGFRLNMLIKNRFGCVCEVQLPCIPTSGGPRHEQLGDIQHAAFCLRLPAHCFTKMSTLSSHSCATCLFTTSTHRSLSTVASFQHVAAQRSCHDSSSDRRMVFSTVVLPQRHRNVLAHLWAVLRLTRGCIPEIELLGQRVGTFKGIIHRLVACPNVLTDLCYCSDTKILFSYLLANPLHYQFLKLCESE